MVPRTLARTTAALVLSLSLSALAAPPPQAAAPKTPERFAPGVVSLPEQEEWRFALSPDGRTAFWSISDGFFPVTRQATIVFAEWRAGRWSAPQVAPFSGVYGDIDPFFSPDGQRLYFSSIRPVDGVAREDVDLWVVLREGDGWGEPRHLGAAVHSPSDELYPSVDADGTLYFASDRPGGLGGFDMYCAFPRADGTYGPAQNLGPALNTAGWEFNPHVTPDGDTLLFTAIGRADGYGLGDLYVARRDEAGVWSPGVNLGPTVNTALDEYHPSLSPDGRALFFVRHSYAPWVPGEVFWVRTRAVGLRP